MSQLSAMGGVARPSPSEAFGIVMVDTPIDRDEGSFFPSTVSIAGAAHGGSFTSADRRDGATEGSLSGPPRAVRGDGAISWRRPRSDRTVNPERSGGRS